MYNIVYFGTMIDNKLINIILLYLGILFNDKLTWKPHIQNLCNKFFEASWALLKLRSIVTDIVTLKIGVF